MGDKETIEFVQKPPSKGSKKDSTSQKLKSKETISLTIECKDEVSEKLEKAEPNLLKNVEWKASEEEIRKGSEILRKQNEENHEEQPGTDYWNILNQIEFSDHEIDSNIPHFL